MSARVLSAVRVIVGVLALCIVFVGSALADEPPTGDHHDAATEVVPPISAAQSAMLATKQAMARADAAYASSGVWNGVTTRLVPRQAIAATPSFICATCDPGGGPPPDYYYLDLRARRQINDVNCGPAAGQVTINYTRGYRYTDITSAGAESTSINWKKQSTIADWMGTDPDTGTSGWQVRNGLMHENNNGVINGIVPPATNWAYTYQTLGNGASNGAEFHSWIEEDVGQWHMPVIPDLKPHKASADYYLPSWSVEVPSAVHWVAIGGYDGYWDGTSGPTVWYAELSGFDGHDWQVGIWPTSALTMWKVTQYLTSRAVW